MALAFFFLFSHSFPSFMLTENLRKSELSIAYLHCLAIKKGFELEHTRIDNDSVDATICANGKITPEAILSSPKVDIQLKATSNWVVENGSIKFKLPLKNYNDLRSNCAVNKILVVLCLPDNEDEWIKYTPDEIVIKKCAYWLNLKGMAETENENNVTVTLSELFDSHILHDTLLKIANQEW